MKKIFCILSIVSSICMLSCNKQSSQVSINTNKTINDIIGVFSNTGFNVGNVLITEGAINITKSISNFGLVNIVLPLSEAQMRGSSITTLSYNNVSALAGSVNIILPMVSLKITEREYDETHDYTGDEKTYTQIDCVITYQLNGKTTSEDFIVHNAECCSVGNTMRSLFRR